MSSKHSSLVAGQLYTLRTAVGNLRNAFNGQDVQWNDVGKLSASTNPILTFLINHFSFARPQKKHTTAAASVRVPAAKMMTTMTTKTAIVIVVAAAMTTTTATVMMTILVRA